MNKFYEKLKKGLEEAIEIEERENNINAMHYMQETMKGEAKKAGIYTEEDVVKLIKDIRHEKKQ